MEEKKRRDNIYFRQTAREFRGARQAAVWAKINRNLPYRLFHMTKDVFLRTKQKLHSKLD